MKSRDFGISKWLVIFSLIFFCFIAGCDNSEKYNIDKYYSAADRDTLLTNILPYITKLDDGVNYGNRFNPENKNYFKQQQFRYKFSFEQYALTEDSIHYFLIWKVAPSLYQKKIAIGGRFKKDSNGKIYAFEELFNTWKMKTEELKEKSFPVFAYMVKNGNVDKYISDRELIEFPDDKCVYDKSQSRWRLIWDMEKDTVKSN
jgi:hypothetical protein